MLYESHVCVCVECNTKKQHGRHVDTTAKEGYGVLFGETIGYYKTGGGYMVLVGETCEYHSSGEEYGVILERLVGTTADWRGMVLVWGRPVSTANR